MCGKKSTDLCKVDIIPGQEELNFYWNKNPDVINIKEIKGWKLGKKLCSAV